MGGEPYHSSFMSVAEMTLLPCDITQGLDGQITRHAVYCVVNDSAAGNVSCINEHKSAGSSNSGIVVQADWVFGVDCELCDFAPMYFSALGGCHFQRGCVD